MEFIFDKEVATTMLHNGQHAELLAYLRDGVKSGNITAKRLLANCYKKGIGVNIDYSKAFMLYTEAAQEGDTVSWRCLGTCYEKGIGTPKNEKKATECYSSALKLGDKKAAEILSKYYIAKNGKEQYSLEAIQCYELAECYDKLALYYVSKYVKHKDYELALYYLYKANEDVEEWTFEDLGDIFYNGTDTKKDYYEAVKWYKKAADVGSISALYKIGLCYLDGGHGLKKSLELAKEYLKKAADFDDANAMYILGVLLMSDESELANAYLTKATKLGNTEAKLYLENNSKKNNTKLYAPSKVRTSFVKNLALKLLKDEIAQFETERRQRDGELEDKKKRISTLEDDVLFLKDEISSGIKAVDKKLSEYDNSIQTLKEEFVNELKTNSKNTEELLTDYLEKASLSITQNVKSDEQLFAIHEQEMKKIFAHNWDSKERIPTMAKDALVSASVLWDKCSDIKDERFDYSGVCILATSAFEDIIKKIFFTDFLRYYKKEYNVHEPSLLECPDTLLYFKPYMYETAIAEYDKEDHGDSSKYACTFLRDKNVTIGSIPYIFTKYVSDIANNNSDRAFVQHKQAINRKVFVEYLQSIVKDEYKENPLESFSLFVSHCETINKNFRNEAAHTKHIEIEKAAQCYAAIIGPNNKIEAYRKMINIEAVLLELFSKLK